jgi:glycosyltransferase involved in cell wall biosynthesis
MTGDRAPLTLMVLTFNEERNLGACLESAAGWAAEIVVVDSGSTDRTAAIAGEYGARVVVHPFETHARQWQWALASVSLTTEWVLALDADQRLMPELRDEITERLRQPGDTAGFYLNRRQIFRGRWIRHGGYYPKHMLKLFRRDSVSLDETELVDHHFHVSGPTATLRFDMIEDNRNEASIGVWVEKHNRYAALQARQDARQAHERSGPDALPRRSLAEAGATAGAATPRPATPDDRTRRLKRAWGRLPLFVRPCLYLFYRYVVRLGFLDGKEGFVFHVLQGFWYRLMVDIYMDELRGEASGVRREDAASPAKLPMR